MTTTYRLQHRLRMRYTDLLQRLHTVGLTPEEAIALAFLRVQLNAYETPLYASLPPLMPGGAGVEDEPLATKEL